MKKLNLILLLLTIIPVAKAQMYKCSPITHVEMYERNFDHSIKTISDFDTEDNITFCSGAMSFHVKIDEKLFSYKITRTLGTQHESEYDKVLWEGVDPVGEKASFVFYIYTNSNKRKMYVYTPVMILAYTIMEI